MPKRPKNQKPPLIPVTDKTEVIPEDLDNKVKALRALTSTLQLLCNTGSFPYSEHTKVHQCVAFIDSMHKQMYDETIKHPQAFMIPGLLPETNKQDEATNGEAKSTSEATV